MACVMASASADGSAESAEICQASVRASQRFLSQLPSVSRWSTASETPSLPSSSSPMSLMRLETSLEMPRAASSPAARSSDEVDDRTPSDRRSRSDSSTREESEPSESWASESVSSMVW